MICNDLDCACAITSTTLSVSGSGSFGDPYSINSNAFAICTSTTRPSSPALGLFIYETNTGRTLVYNGTSWVWQNGNPPHFQIEQQVVQSIPDNTVTTVVLGTEVIDTDAFHTGTNGFVTIPTTWGGDYVIWAHSRWEASSASYRYVDFLVANNGAAPVQVLANGSGGAQMVFTANAHFAVSGMVRLRAAATVTARVIQASGAALDLTSVTLKGTLINHIPTLV